MLKFQATLFHFMFQATLFHCFRDKLDEELQEIDVVMGLVSINPRYSPKVIQEQAMSSTMDVINTLVRMPKYCAVLGDMWCLPCGQGMRAVSRAVSNRTPWCPARL
jgi:hypothetical protein